MILQIFFAVDAGIGLRILVTEVGRQYFMHHGWYGRRRPVQAALILASFLTISAVTSSWLLSVPRTSLGNRLAIAGSVVSMFFFLVVAISLHSTESLALMVFGKILGWVLTGAGIWLGVQDHRSL
jgi:hypothetical protein